MQTMFRTLGSFVTLTGLSRPELLKGTALCFEGHTKHTITLRGENQERLMLQQTVSIVTTIL